MLSEFQTNISQHFTLPSNFQTITAVIQFVFRLFKIILFYNFLVRSLFLWQLVWQFLIIISSFIDKKKFNLRKMEKQATLVLLFSRFFMLKLIFTNVISFFYLYLAISLRMEEVKNKIVEQTTNELTNKRMSEINSFQRSVRKLFARSQHCFQFTYTLTQSKTVFLCRNDMKNFARF